jgi:hypothetical protein
MTGSGKNYLSTETRHQPDFALALGWHYNISSSTYLSAGTDNSGIG